MNEIVKIDPKEFGIEESKAADIAAQFKPMLDKMVELEAEYNQVISLPVESNETAIKARVLRMKYVKVRTGTAEIHKQQKAFYLMAGRFVDGWKNAQLFASEGIEKKLEDIEKHYENIEKQRIARLRTEREEILLPYHVENVSSLNLGEMTESVFQNFLLGTKTAYENKIEAERLAEERRLAELEAERIRQEEMRLENERLKKEAEEKEKILAAERAEAARVAKEAADALAAQAAESARLAKIEAERQAAILKAEKDKADKLAAELQVKKDAELKAQKEAAAIEAERVTAEKKAARAPVKEKLKLAISNLDLVLPDSEISQDIRIKFDGFKNWALQQIETL